MVIQSIASLAVAAGVLVPTVVVEWWYPPAAGSSGMLIVMVLDGFLASEPGLKGWRSHLGTARRKGGLSYGRSGLHHYHGQSIIIEHARPFRPKIFRACWAFYVLRSMYIYQVYSTAIYFFSLCPCIQRIHQTLLMARLSCRKVTKGSPSYLPVPLCCNIICRNVQ